MKRLLRLSLVTVFSLLATSCTTIEHEEDDDDDDEVHHHPSRPVTTTTTVEETRVMPMTATQQTRVLTY